MKRVILLLFFLSAAQSVAQRDEPLAPSRLPEPVQWLQKYLQIPSVSGQEARAGSFLKELCKSHGLFVKEMGQEDGNYNFTASLFPLEDNKPNIVLLNHLDVVPESENNIFGPYSGVIENGSMYGRGAVDNKGAAIMQLAALVRIKQVENYRESEYNISLLSVSCEETQCPGGIQHVLENFRNELNAAVVIGEGPTEITELLEGEFPKPIFGISVAHKRAYWLELELEIETLGHGSVTPVTYANKELVTALDKLLTKKQKTIFNEVNTGFLKEMAHYRTGLERFVLKHPRFFKPLLVPKLRKSPELFSIFSNTVTLTNLNSSSQALNTNSVVARAGLDCRLLPETDEVEFEADLRKRLKNDKIKITVVKSTPRNRPSSSKTLFYENLQAAILENYPGVTTMKLIMPNINDMGYFRAKDVPAYGTIPINLSRIQAKSIHGDDEYITLKALNDGTSVFYNFLKKMIYHRSSVQTAP
jgi:acetylornithine deacetylase/succinyl-diaminopimelate desuccinylase-like protein